jgi:hypothetical protein
MGRLKTAEVADALTPDERRFLRLAAQRHRANDDWFEFESFAFGMHSPLFRRRRSHLDVLQHPLYVALKEMWIDLGRKQGFVANDAEEASAHGTRRKAIRSRPADDRRNTPKKHHVATAYSMDRACDRRATCQPRVTPSGFIPCFSFLPRFRSRSRRTRRGARGRRARAGGAALRPARR